MIHFCHKHVELGMLSNMMYEFCVNDEYLMALLFSLPLQLAALSHPLTLLVEDNVESNDALVVMFIIYFCHCILYVNSSICINFRISFRFTKQLLALAHCISFLITAVFLRTPFSYQNKVNGPKRYVSRSIKIYPAEILSGGKLDCLLNGTWY